MSPSGSCKRGSCKKKCGIMIFGVFEKNYLDFLITQFSVREVGNETVIVSVEIRLKLFKSCVANMSE